MTSSDLIIPSVAQQFEVALTNPNLPIDATNDIEAITIWLLEYKNSKNTFDSYRQCSERFYLWIRSTNKSLIDIIRNDVQEYQDFLLNPQPKHTWCGKKTARSDPDWKPFCKGLAASSIRLQLWIITNLYNYLIDAGYLTKNPFRLIRRKPKIIASGIEKILSITEINYIFDFIHKLPEDTYNKHHFKEQWLWIISLLYLTGCRRDEVTKAKMADFIHTGNQWWFQIIGKGSKHGEIPASQSLMSALIRYRSFLGLPDYPTSDEQIPLIVGLRGMAKPITNTRLYQLIKELCNNVANAIDHQDSSAAFKLRNVSTHWFRHSSATHQVDASIDIRIVKENLCYSSL